MHLRRGRSLLDVGNDPDYRFTLANERTFLAWIRTALGLLAGGVAVRSVLPSFGPPGIRTALALALLALGTLVAAGSYRRWERTERALRLGERLPTTALPRLVAYGIVVLALGVTLVILAGDVG